MKKLLMLSILFVSAMAACAVSAAYADESDQQIIKDAIDKYKDKNYLGCISDLKDYTKEDPSNAVAWYYLGSAYMTIGMKTESHAAFQKVAELNTVPALTSYAIQAEICMENTDKCKYQNFTNEQIKQLKANPVNFLESYAASLVPAPKNAETVEIEKLIKNPPSSKMHRDASDFVRDEKLKMKTTQTNRSSAYIPDGSYFSNTADLLKYENSDITSFAMMTDMPLSDENNDYKTITPEMVQMYILNNSDNN